MDGKQTNILYIGRNADILETVMRLLNKNEQWCGFGAGTDEEAMQQFQQNNCDLVLLGPGISDASEAKLCAFFKQQKPGILIVQHYGGGSGLLAAEIEIAMAQKK